MIKYSNLKIKVKKTQIKMKLKNIMQINLNKLNSNL